MKTIIVISILIGCVYSQMPKLPPGLQAALQAAMGSSRGSSSAATKTSSASGFPADFLSKLQQLPATKTQASMASTMAPPTTTPGQSPLEQLMFLKTVGLGAGGLFGGGMQNPMKLMMLQGVLGGGGGGRGGQGGRGAGGGGFGGGGMGGGGGFLRTTIQFRLCDEADLQKIPCMMCDIESFKRFRMPFKFFKCNPMMPRYLPPSMKFGCCYKDMRAMMMAKQMSAR